MDRLTDRTEVELALKAEVEKFFPAYPEIGNHALSATGEEYLEIVSGYKAGIARCRSEEDAIMIWRWRVRHYIESLPSLDKHISAPTKIYWRVLPEIGKQLYQDGIGTREFWGVYSRFMISDKPVIGPQHKVHP